MAQQLKENSLPVALASDTDTMPVGGIYLATKPTYTDGQRASGQFNSKGGLYVEQMVTPDDPKSVPFFKHLTVGTLSVVRALSWKILSFYITQSSGVVVWAQIYDAAVTTGLTLGTNAPLVEFPINNNAGASLVLPAQGWKPANGIVVGFTTGPSGPTAQAGVYDITIFGDQ
jgi:hypothetical protein